MEIKITFNIHAAEIKTINKDKLFLQKALQIIEKNMDQTSFNMEQFSKELGISRVHLHRKLKTLTDQSASEFIRSIRLKRAAFLLQQQIGSVSEIAYLTGYNNLSYFTRCFKEQYGVTPSGYSLQQVQVQRLKQSDL
jgi:AraC-like DNA-binding protein